MSILMSSSINRRQENELESELEIEVFVIKSWRYYIDEKDDYIKKKIRSWSRSNFKDENLWKQFRHDFADWDEVRFRFTTLEAQRKLRAYLRLHDVWIRQEREIVITKTFANTMKKKRKHHESKKKLKVTLNFLILTSLILFAKRILNEIHEIILDKLHRDSNHEKYHLDNHFENHLNLENHLDFENHHFKID
jgi:hypothetical protein